MQNLNLTIVPLVLFGFVASITPGPNNLLLMRSGAMFGVRRSLLHLFGVQAGFILLLVLSHVGVTTLLLGVPVVKGILRWACFAYLMYLGWLILRDGKPRPAHERSASSQGRPQHFTESLLFQLINPKAWMMAVTVASAFYGNARPTQLDLAMASLISVCVGGPCMLVWTVWGASIDRVLHRPRARQLFSYVMALMVAATAVWMLR